jgi:hypothetical protein
MGDEDQITPALLSEDDLVREFRKLRADEHDVSYERRLMHGRIDVVRAEILNRMAESETRSDSLEGMVARLSLALAHAGPPDIEGELAKLGAEAASDVEARFPDLEEALPDLAEMSEEELAGTVLALGRRERAISARRQQIIRRLDLVRAERVARLQNAYADVEEA